MSLACVGSTRSVPATPSLPRLMVGVCASHIYTAQAPGCSIGSSPQVACGSNFRVLHKSSDSFGPAFCAFPGRSNSGSQELESALSVGALSPTQSQPQFLHALLWCVRLVSVLGSWSLAVTLPADVNHPESQKVFDQKLGTCLQFGRGCLLWSRICSFPSPCRLPLAGDGLVHRQLALPWNCSVLPLFLSNVARSSPFSPHLLVADASIRSTFLLGVDFRHVICGFYLFFLPVKLPSEIQKLPPDLPVREFTGVWKLPLLRLPSRDGSLSLTLLSLFLSFYFILPPFEDNGCFSGHLMSSASNQKLFCRVCSAFKCSFDEFVGEKMVSPSYSSTILAPPAQVSFNIMAAVTIYSDFGNQEDKICYYLHFSPFCFPLSDGTF